MYDAVSQRLAMWNRTTQVARVHAAVGNKYRIHKEQYLVYDAGSQSLAVWNK